VCGRLIGYCPTDVRERAKQKFERDLITKKNTMTPTKADALIQRLQYYEANSHFDGYTVALGEYRRACQSHPITMAFALKRYEYRGRLAEAEGTVSLADEQDDEKQDAKG